MEPAEHPPRLFTLQDFLQRLRQAGWLAKLCHQSEHGEGGDTVSSHSNDSDRGKKDPKADSATEEFLAVLPEGTELPKGFAAEAKKLGLDPTGKKRVPYPAYVLGAGAYFNPASLGLDWRLNAPPDSAAYKEAIENPKDSLDEGDRETLKIMIDMGLPPYTD